MDSGGQGINPVADARGSDWGWIGEFAGKFGLPGYNGGDMTDLIVTIDGPAGSGKSTVAKLLAARLGVTYLDTGAMYRAVTWAALDRRVDLTDGSALAELAGRLKITLQRSGQGDRVLVDGYDITEAIRTSEVSAQAHYIAGAAAVREQLVSQQRRIGETAGSLVTEGRDQGSVVFPDAGFKFYLDASAECRARRRWLQLREKDSTVKLEDVLAAQRERDHRDSTRAVGPMKVPDDAIVVDTSEMAIDDVVEYLYGYIAERREL
ncbi:MAG: (d)CMP kinase [Sedimentisphaerales bacterium]|nr:(d)CMP kinase [Sedimentisphaerales bacterium]